MTSPPPDHVDGPDLSTEPDGDPDTVADLGPLAPLAGTWESAAGHDLRPVAPGAEEDVFVERDELQPVDPQTNGPQPLYGLRYHTHITRPGEVETFHDQVGYRRWEPATRTGTWSYEEEGVLDIPGRDAPLAHVDRNTLRRVAPPVPDPLAGGRA